VGKDAGKGLNVLTGTKHCLPILHFILQQADQHPNVSSSPANGQYQVLTSPAELLSRSSPVVHSAELVWLDL
jgi:hypothetical protein